MTEVTTKNKLGLAITLGFICFIVQIMPWVLIFVVGGLASFYYTHALYILSSIFIGISYYRNSMKLIIVAVISIIVTQLIPILILFLLFNK
jgi:hypothetical protein